MTTIDPVRHPRLHLVSQGALWLGKDAFPGTVGWADEVEQWLQSVPESVFTQHYLPRLRAEARQRNKTLAEIAPAFFFQSRCQVPIGLWQPPGAGATKGEYLIGWPPSQVFVEVKSPSWEAEVVDSEGKDSDRLLLPKHVDDEVRAVEPWRHARGAIEKASLKMPESIPTLVVLNDDLFVSLDFASALNMEIALDGTGGCFRDGRHPNVGATGVFQVEMVAGELEYRFTLFTNPAAAPAVELPSQVREALAGWSASRKQVAGLPSGSARRHLISHSGTHDPR